MKNFLYPILLASLAILPMAISSCSDDDDDAKTENQSNNSADNPSDTSAIDKSDYLKYTITSENEVSVSGVNGNVPIYVVIPEQVTIDGKTYAVTGIANSAFKDCGDMLTIAIPNSVTAIGDSAFYNCGSLINVSISDSVTSIADYTFAECKSLMNVTIPSSVVSIGEKAFENCSSLINVTIPDGVVKIGERAFENCSSLINVSIPSSVDSIFESGMVCGYPYVDLGLPSGLKWASYNVGATSILQYGNYYEFRDGRAAASWGNSWRQPSKSELNELKEGCYWRWVDGFFGISGQLGTSKTNGKQIFLPATGYKDSGNNLQKVGAEGLYWSSDWELIEGYASSTFHYSNSIFYYLDVVSDQQPYITYQYGMGHGYYCSVRLVSE